MPQALAPPARPSALIVDGDAFFREAIREASDGYDLIEALRNALTSRGYDVVVSSCPEEAQRLAQERRFDRIYSDGTLPLGQSPRVQEAPSGPRVEDLRNGMARVQIDQALPWSAAVELLDVLADIAPEEPQRLS
jgi:CheY-like chemotaxis protein